MAEGTQDVPAESSPATSETPPTPDSGAAPVSAGTGFPADRPVENVLAEWNRKFQGLEERLGQVVGILVQQQQGGQAQAANAGYTDEQLYQLAAAGNTAAMQQLDQRREQRLTQTWQQQQHAQQTLALSLQQMLQRYPIFTDNTHPLTQAATAYKQRLIAAGAQDGPATILEAMRQAIIDHPELVPRASETPELQRRVGAQAAAMVDGGQMNRRPPAPEPKKKAPQLTPELWKLAQRYGYTDKAKAQKALENFERRQESGQSRLGLVGTFLREEG